MKRSYAKFCSLLLALVMLCTQLTVLAEVSWTALPETPYKAENEY